MDSKSTIEKLRAGEVDQLRFNRGARDVVVVRRRDLIGRAYNAFASCFRNPVADKMLPVAMTGVGICAATLIAAAVIA